MFGKDFNPNTITPDNGCYFGLSHDPESAALVLLSAPWDTTTSLRSGSSYAPDAIIEVSRYVDFYEPLAPNSWQKGIATAPIDYSIQDLSHRLRSDAERVINLHDELGMSVIDNLMYDRRLRRVNEGSVEVNNNIFQQASNWLSKDKISKKKSNEELPNIVKSHSSIVLRKLYGVDMKLQANKQKY
jgi:agmatinase